MSKWTPGPWSVNPRGRIPMVYFNGDVHLPIVPVVNGYDADTCNANARLIAAAPEMAEVLKEIMSWEENDEMTWGPKARALLAKVNA